MNQHDQHDQQNKNRKAAVRMVLVFIAIHFLTVITQIIYPENWQVQGLILSSMVFFAIGAILMIVIEKRYNMQFSFEESYKKQKKHIWLWGILGIFIALFTQSIASFIEVEFLGAPTDSVNTQMIVEIIRQYPIFILFAGVAGPIMEEYVFRKALFGVLFDRIGGIGSAVISSLLFAFVHLDGHYLLYSSMALVFCWLYYKTKNLWTPIIAHCLMNILAVLSNLYLV